MSSYQKIFWWLKFILIGMKQCLSYSLSFCISTWYKTKLFFLTSKTFENIFFSSFWAIKKFYNMSHIASCTIITIWPKFIYIKVMSIWQIINNYWPLHVTGIPWKSNAFSISRNPKHFQAISRVTLIKHLLISSANPAFVSIFRECSVYQALTDAALVVHLSSLWKIPSTLNYTLHQWRLWQWV